MSRIGTNTGHGHVWARPDGIKARCGGPNMCSECALDFAEVHNKPTPTPAPAPMTAKDEHQEFSAVMKWLRTLPPLGMIAELIINRKIDALTARVAELERERDVAVECHGHALALAKKELARANLAESELAAARKVDDAEIVEAIKDLAQDRLSAKVKFNLPEPEEKP